MARMHSIEIMDFVKEYLSDHPKASKDEVGKALINKDRWLIGRAYRNIVNNPIKSTLLIGGLAAGASALGYHFDLNKHIPLIGGGADRLGQWTHMAGQNAINYTRSWLPTSIGGTEGVNYLTDPRTGQIHQPGTINPSPENMIT